MTFLDSITSIFSLLPVFVLVLFRIAGLAATAPVFSSAGIPVQIRVILAFTLALIVFPLVPPVAYNPDNLLTLVFGVAAEMLIGIAIGFILSLIFVGIQIGAELIGQQMGLSLAQIVDPLNQDENNVLSQFYLMIATVIFLLINGHIILIGALLRTFHQIPLMRGGFLFTSIDHGDLLSQVLWQTCDVLRTACELSIRIAGPALIAVFLATLALGFISRTMPQLNILAAGFPVNITLALIILIVSIAAAGQLCQTYILKTLDILYGLFAP